MLTSEGLPAGTHTRMVMIYVQLNIQREAGTIAGECPVGNLDPSPYNVAPVKIIFVILNTRHYW